MKYKDFKTMSQNEMKNVKGGNAPGGGCCAHLNTPCTDCGSEHWHCGLSQAGAQAMAAEMAIVHSNNAGYQVHAYWCCASCPQNPQ